MSAPYPTITALGLSAGQVVITGTSMVPAPAFGTVTIEVYALAIDPSGLGEGRTFIGSVDANSLGKWTLTSADTSIGCYSAFLTDTPPLI